MNEQSSYPTQRRDAFVLALPGALATAVGAVETVQNGPGRGIIAFALGLILLFSLLAVLRWCYARIRAVRWVLLGGLVLCLIGQACTWLFPRSFTPLTPPPAEPIVQLRCATLPSVLQVFAVHCWFAEFDPADGRWHRWEVWQEPNVSGTSWGHVHKDLMSPSNGVGGGPSQILAEWRGEAARDLRSVLATSPGYPDRARYFAWPGPNSNTYVAWVLRRARISADLPPMALGKDYLGTAGAAITTTGAGVQLESSSLGLKMGLLDGAELHFLCFTFGIDLWTPALKTPLGRIGFADS